MTKEQFLSEIKVLLKDIVDELEIEARFLPEDHYQCDIEWPKKEWGYVFEATSWVSIYTAIKAAQLNGDFDDPKEKFPESF